jgi:hypothetical protein
MSLTIPGDSSAFTTLAKENEDYYRSLGPQNNERVTFAIDFVIERGIEGAYKVFLSNFDLNNVFTGGCRPEIKQECKLLFGCLNKDMNEPSLRARQKFVTEEYSDQVQISLFLHVIEIWCPGLIRDETLLSAHIDTSLLPNKGSCSFSSLLSDAQIIVKTFRVNYRETILKRTEDRRIAEILEKQELSTSADDDVNENGEDIDKHAIIFDFKVPFHTQTLQHYSDIQDVLDRVSSQTSHIVDYIRQNCEEGCGIISDSELLIKNFFTLGKRPEIKKETKRLFGWLSGKELEFLLDRARQKFTHKSDADHYRYSLFLYIMELWRPNSSTAEALRNAYIPPTRTAFTGIISSALKTSQRAVYELRQDLREGGKPDAAHVKITKFQKQHRIRQLSFVSQDYSGVLDLLRRIFMSKVEQIKLNVSVDLANKRKLQFIDNNLDDGSSSSTLVRAQKQRIAAAPPAAVTSSVLSSSQSLCPQPHEQRQDHDCHYEGVVVTSVQQTTTTNEDR